MKSIVLTASILSAAAGPALAHHSQVMFDRTKETVLDGTIKEFNWSNPHGWVRIVVPDAAGAMKEWTVELPPIVALLRGGWTNHTLKPGDKVVMKIAPLYSGSAGGSYKQVTLPDGRVLGERQGGGPPPP